MEFIVIWIIAAAVILICAYVLPGITTTGFSAALVAALVLGVINALIKPLLLLLTLPINLLTLGFFTFVINALLIMLVANIVTDFKVANFWWALLLGVIISIVVSFVEVKINFNKINNMKGYVTNIEKLTTENENFRKVLYTSGHSQLVLMSLKPKEEIGMEVHEDNDQFFRVEKGHGQCIIDGNEYDLEDGSAVVVPAGAQHNVINTSESDDLKLYTIYSPAHHKDQIVRSTKKEAEDNEAEFDGQTTE